MQSLFTILSVILYLGGTLSIGLNLKRLSLGQPQHKTALLVCWGGGIVFHGLALLPNIATHSGFDLGFSNALSLVALILVALLFVSAPRRPAEVLGIFVMPLAIVSLLFDQFFPEHGVALPLNQPGIQIHILVSLLAYSVLMLSALQAIILAIQDHHLHRHRPGGLIRALPPLRDTEQLLFQLIALGFVLLSLSLASGFFFLDDLFAQHLVHKTILSLTAWAIFAILLWGRWRFGWRGRTALRWTLAGFVVLMLAYFGTKLVLEIILQRG